MTFAVKTKHATLLVFTALVLLMAASVLTYDGGANEKDSQAVGSEYPSGDSASLRGDHDTGGDTVVQPLVGHQQHERTGTDSLESGDQQHQQ